MRLNDSNGQFYFAHFQHIRNFQNKPVGTTCYFHVGPCAVKERPCQTAGMVMGSATCSKRDVFNRETGRKVSLLRAMKQVVNDKNVREQLWKDYFDQIALPRAQRRSNS